MEESKERKESRMRETASGRGSETAIGRETL
jgi:hypothetical protein